MPGTPAGTAGTATWLSLPRYGSTHSCLPTGRTESRADERTGPCSQSGRLSGDNPFVSVVSAPANWPSACMSAARTATPLTTSASQTCKQLCEALALLQVVGAWLSVEE